MTAAPGMAAGDPQDLVPPWLRRLAAVGWRLLATVVMGLVLVTIAIELASATAATLVALVLAAALAPTVRGLRARGLSRTAAAAAACVAGGAVIVGATLLVVLALVSNTLSIAKAVTAGLDGVRDQLVALGAPELVVRVFDRFVAAVVGLFVVDVGSLVGPAITVGTVVVLGTFLTFFLLQDGDRGWAWLMRSLDPWRVETVTASAVQGLDRVAYYLRRTAVFATLDALVVFAVLTALGVPLAAGLAAVAFLAGFVPYLGAIMGGAVIGLATLALAGVGPAIAVLGALLVTAALATRALNGTALGRGTDVHPLVVLVALPIGATLFGLLGLIVSLPIAVFAMAIGRAVIAALDLGPDHPARRRGTDGAPVWLDRLAQWSWRGLVVTGLAFVAIQVVIRVPSVVVPALIAVVSAATLLPLVDRLERRGWSRGVAAGVSTVGAAAAIVGIVLVALAMTAGPLREIIDTALDGARLIDLAWLVGAVVDLGSGVTINVGGLLADAFALALALVLALLMTFFFLRDGTAVWRHVLGLVGPTRREPIAAAGSRAVHVLAGYMVGTAIISAFGAFTSGLIMVILGLPLALPIAVLTFFASFIPYIGSAITTALAFLVALAVGTTSDIVIMAVYTVVFNIVQGNFVTPIVYGRSLSLHPAIVLMAIPVGGEIAGILGMFLVVPFAAIIAATWRLVLEAIAVDESPSIASAPPADDDARAAVPVDADVAAGTHSGTAPPGRGTVEL